MDAASPHLPTLRPAQPRTSLHPSPHTVPASGTRPPAWGTASPPGLGVPPPSGWLPASLTPCGGRETKLCHSELAPDPEPAPPLRAMAVGGRKSGSGVPAGGPPSVAESPSWREKVGAQSRGLSPELEPTWAPAYCTQLHWARVREAWRPAPTACNPTCTGRSIPHSPKIHSKGQATAHGTEGVARSTWAPHP